MGKHRRWRLAYAVAVLIAGVSLGACSPPPVEQHTLRIGFFPLQDFLPYFVMQERGLDRQNGLRFEEKLYAGGAAIIEAMATGAVDVGPGVGSVPVLSAAERGLIPNTVVPVAANDFADPAHPGVAVMVSNSIQSWRDLQGKHIAINLVNSITTAAVKGRLELEGVKGYHLVEISFPNMGLAVAGGNVAAAGMNDPYLTQSLLRGDGKLLGWVLGGPPLTHSQVSLIVVRGDFYRSNPRAVKAFLRAHLQAVAWMNQNEEQARSILAKRLDLHKEVGRKMYLYRWPPDARNDPALLEGMQPSLVNIGMLKAPIPAGRLYDETLLNEVLAEKR